MRRIFSILLALIIAISTSAPAFADKLEAPDGSDVQIIAVKAGDSTRAEETCWYYRVHNGMVQMRKWSITYRKWLTDWIDIGPYEGG